MNLELRRQVMAAKDENIIYMARDLKCTGNNAFDTGFAPYATGNANKDFKITIRVKSITSPASNLVILGCKYEGTLEGQQWPGFYFRLNKTTKIQIGGYNYYNPTISSILGKNVYIWRKGSNYYAQIDGQTQTSLSVRVATFDQNIVIGAGVQTDGTYFRYANCNIDYVRIEYI